MQVCRVIRESKKVGKTSIKGVNMVVVQFMSDSFVQYGLNVHECGKVEFFRDSCYTVSKGAVFDAMMKAAKDFIDNETE